MAHENLVNNNSNGDPAFRYYAVTPHDSTDLAEGPCRALYIGGAGNIVLVRPQDGVAVTFSGVLAGTFLPCYALRVNSTNTTATNIVALY